MENFGKYIIERKIGEGATATVYLAKDSILNRDVALKIMKSQSFGSSIDFKKLFIDEAQRIAKLNHKNIIQVYDAGIEDNRVYLAMEYLAGGTLKERMTDGRTFDPISVITEIAEALHYAYTNNSIIHRDLKPANIIFRRHADSSIEAVLTDFGISKTEGMDSDFTEIDVNVGTPRYMSPEQLMRVPIDNRSDLYTLGIILYEILSGEKPFPDTDTMIGIQSKIRNPPPKLPEREKKYQYIINKLITPHVDDRYANAKELINDLSLLQGNKSIVHEQKPHSNSKISTIIAAAAFTTIALIAFGSWYYYDKTQSAQQELEESLKQLQQLSTNAQTSKLSEDINSTDELANRIISEYPDNKIATQVLQEMVFLKQALSLEKILNEADDLIAQKDYAGAKSNLLIVLGNNNISTNEEKRAKEMLQKVEELTTLEQLGDLKLSTSTSKSPINPDRNELPEIIISTSNSIYLHCTYQTPKTKEIYRLFPIANELANNFSQLKSYTNYGKTQENTPIKIPYGESETGISNIHCFITSEPKKAFMSLFEDHGFSQIKGNHNLDDVMGIFKDTPYIEKGTSLEFY